MRIALASVVGAFAASACCIGPVVFTLAGVGALSASAMWLEPYRPVFLGATLLLLTAAFWREYRAPVACADHMACPTNTRRGARFALWVIAALVLALVTFPYYINAII